MFHRIFSFGLSVSLLAAAAGAQVVSYNFNGLNGANFPAPPPPLGGQDGWVDHSTGTQLGVRATGINGTPCAYFDSVNASHQGFASHVDSSAFDTPDLSGNERFYVEALVGPSPFSSSDGQISLGYDQNADGVIAAGERGATLLFGVNGIGVRDALGNQTVVPVANAGGALGWHRLRLRLVVDPVESKCTLYAQNVSTGGTHLKTVTGLVGVPFASDSNQTDARNPSRWNGVDVGATGRGVWVDDLAFGRFRRSSLVQTFEGFTAGSTPPYAPLAGQGPWSTSDSGTIHGVVAGGGFDGSKCVEQLGYGAISRKHDTYFGLPPLLGSETDLRLSLRLRLATGATPNSQVMFGYDQNGDGLISPYTDPEPSFGIGAYHNPLGAAVFVQNAQLAATYAAMSPLGASPGDWLEIVLVMNLAADRYDVYARNLTTNGAQVLMISNGLAGFTENLDSSNPRLWDGIAILCTGLGARFDSIDVSIGTPTDPIQYCTAQMSSAGCTPVIDAGGTPSLSDAQPFTIVGMQMLPSKTFILIYSSVGPNDAPLLGGTLCVQPPFKRTPVGTTSSGTGCSAQASVNFEAYVQSGADPLLQAGSSVWAQIWSRDPAGPTGTNLTGALAFELSP